MSAALSIDKAQIELLSLGTHPQQTDVERTLVLLAREGGLGGVVTKPARYSATTIQWWIDCERLFYWPTVAGLESPPSPQQKFGTKLHKYQENYLKDGTLPDRTTPEGHLASIGLPLLPRPGTPGLYVEEPFEILFDGLPVAITGTRDFGVDPIELDAKSFMVGDHKTAGSKNPKYRKTKPWLESNVQSNIYSYTKWAELLAKGFDQLRVVDKQWAYYFKAEKQADKLRSVDSLDYVAEQYEKTIKPAVIGMARMVREMPRVGDVATPKDKSVCDAYGGCPHRARCFGMGIKNEAMGVQSARFTRANITAKTFEDVHPNVNDLTGQVFGRLAVLRRSTPATDAGRHALWDVRCSCGTEKTTPSHYLLHGMAQSCGCLRSDRNIERNTTHGMSHLPEYVVWLGMLRRCNDPGAKDYSYYGARGIRVSDEWHDFPMFYAAMGPRPTEDHSIDRIDNDKGYELGNCRWATAKEQRSNQRPRAGKEDKKMGLLAGKFTRDAINTKVASGAGTAVNPPPAKTRPALKQVEEPIEDDDGVEADAAANEAQEEAPPPKAARAKKPKGAEQLVAETAEKLDKAFAKSPRTPGTNPDHNYWLLVGTEVTKGAQATPIQVDDLLGVAQAMAMQMTDKEHYRLEFGGHALLEAAFTKWMEENAIVGVVKVPRDLSPGAANVIGLLRAHASMVFEP